MALSRTQEECKVCGQVVPFLDQLTAGGSVYHPTCFQCEHCKTVLKLSDYSLHEGKTYCKLHLDELFGRSPEGRRESTEGLRKSVEGLRRSFEGSPLKNMAKNLVLPHLSYHVDIAREKRKFTIFCAATNSWEKRVIQVFWHSGEVCNLCQNCLPFGEGEDINERYYMFLQGFHAVNHGRQVVWMLMQVSVEGQSYHKTCFKCLQGGCAISPSNYAALEGRVYCKPHFRQLFKEKGNYSQLLMKMPSSKLPDPEKEQ